MVLANWGDGCVYSFATGAHTTRHDPQGRVWCMVHGKSCMVHDAWAWSMSPMSLACRVVHVPGVDAHASNIADLVAIEQIRIRTQIYYTIHFSF